MYPVGSLSLSVHCSTKIISQVPTISINVLNPTITTSNILTTPSLLYVHGCSLLSPLNSLSTQEPKYAKAHPELFRGSDACLDASDHRCLALELIYFARVHIQG